jgi:hypothetical protein
MLWGRPLDTISILYRSAFSTKPRVLSERGMSGLPKTIPDREWIIADPAQSFRWQTHDFPCNIARWNYHPEYEIHLIRKSFGRAFVGDHIGEFGPGYLAIVGSNLPHNWVSDLEAGQVVRDRDVVPRCRSAV